MKAIRIRRNKNYNNNSKTKDLNNKVMINIVSYTVILIVLTINIVTSSVLLIVLTILYFKTRCFFAFVGN